MNAIVTLKKGEGRTLKSGGAWIFDNEIASVVGNFDNGDLVIVHDFDGYGLGKGFINWNSKIRVRMLTRNPDQEIDRDFFRMRVKNAWEYRKKTVDTGSCRVIFGEADFLPGLVVDKFADVLVVQSLALGMDRFKEWIVEILKELLAKDGISIRGVYERSDAKEREKEGMERHKGFLGEPFDTQVEIVENGGRFLVDVRDRTEDGIFPGSEVQPPGGAEALPGRAGFGLFHPHRFLCPECRDCRGQGSAGSGCLGDRDFAGGEKCQA